MRVHEVIEKHHDEIVTEWAQSSELMSRGSLTPRALIDHVPELLRHLVVWLRQEGPDQEAAYDTTAVKHALARLSQDIDLPEVVDEYRVLRAVVHRRALALTSDAVDVRDIIRLDEALDAAIATVVHNYAERRDRVVRHEATRLRVALAAARLGAWEWNPLTREGVLDARASELHGHPAGEPFTRDALLAVVHPEDRARLEEALNATIEGRRDDLEVEYRAVVNGRERWLRSTMSVLEWSDAGYPIRIVGTTLNISRAKRAELRAQKSKKELEALARIGSALAAERTFDEFLHDLLEVFLESSPAVDTATILLYEPDPTGGGGHLRVRASIGLEDETRTGYRIPFGKGFAGTIAATRKPLLLHDAAHSPLVLSEWVRKRGIRALYGVPLVSDGDLVGVAHIGSLTQGEFSDEVITLFTATAERAASSILHARIRDELAKKNAQLEAIMAAIPDALFVAEPDRIALANPAAREILGTDSPTSSPIPDLTDRMHARDPATNEPFPPDQLPLVRALRGEHVVGSMVVQHATLGQERHARVAAAPIEVAGRVVGAVAIWSDITAVVDLERQRETFMHAIVHDLRNPLQSIVSTAQLVAQRIGEDAWAKDRLDRISRNALRLDRLLGDLLDITLARSGHIEVKRELVRLGKVIEEEAAMWSASSATHRLHVEACDAEVVGDPERIIQVLDNLLGNAIKYSPEGGPIDVSCVREHGEAVVTIRDHGIGIAEEEQRDLFNPYTRVGRHAWAVGHGLGLYISSEIVRKLGGRIGVQSEPGHGSSFWFTLPIAVAAGGA